jgi:membrane associated rhomboid family serine protease
MLFPIGDDNQGRLTKPLLVYTFIALNAFVFIFLQGAGMSESGAYFTYGYAAVPYEIRYGVDLVGAVPVEAERGRTTTSGEARIPQSPGPVPIYLTLLTSMFMHGSWAHIIGNMLYLWIFGDNVEDRLGHLKFLLFYVIAGLVASFAQIMIDPESKIPTLGASGAIAGVLGAYLVWFPHNRVRALAGLGFFWTTIELPALVVLGFWIVIQIFSQYASSFSTRSGGVAYMAHIGGFVAGVVVGFLFRSRSSRPSRSAW